MSVDYRGIVKWQEQMLKEHPDWNTNYPLKYKMLVDPIVKLGGKKKKSGNSGGVGRVARRKRRALCVCHAVRKSG